jgi:hypothetical protein
LKHGISFGQSIKSSVTPITLTVFVVSLLTLSLYASRVLQSEIERLAGELQVPAAQLVAGKVAH